MQSNTYKPDKVKGEKMRIDELDKEPMSHRIGYKYLKICDDSLTTFKTPYNSTPMKLGKWHNCKDEKGNIPTTHTNSYDKYTAGYHYYRGRDTILKAIKCGEYDTYFQVNSFRDCIVRCEVKEVLHTGYTMLKGFNHDDIKVLIGVSEYIKPIEIIYQHSIFKSTHTAAFLKKLTDNQGMKKIIDIYKKYRMKIIKLNGFPFTISEKDMARIFELLVNTETSLEFTSLLCFDSKSHLLRRDPFVSFLKYIGDILSKKDTFKLKTKMDHDAAIASFKFTKFRNHSMYHLMMPGIMRAWNIEDHRDHYLPIFRR